MRILVGLFVRRDYRGMANIPASGPLVVASNHVSDVDPFVLGDYLTRCGRHGHFLAKQVLFTVPVFGRFLRAARQVAVSRDTLAAGRAMTEAARAAGAGATVVIYPEGKETLDPTNWPMTGKPGAAAVAIATGAPLVPVAVWGTQRIRGHGYTFRLFPRRDVTVLAGAPIDSGEFAGLPERERLESATDRVMAAILDLEQQVREQAAPRAVVAGRPGWPPRVARRRLASWRPRRD